MSDQKNTILAIVLSALVLLTWEYFIGMPKRDAALRQQQQEQAQLQSTPSTPSTPQSPSVTPNAPPQASGLPVPAGMPASPLTRAQALDASPRVRIDTPTLEGSIALKGARIDDLALKQFHETVDPNSPPIELLSPPGTPDPFFAESGWIDATQTHMIVGPDTVWRQEGKAPLGVNHPVTFVYSDPATGLEFRRVISVDDKYLFHIADQVTNKSASPVTVFPYSRISRYGTPKTSGYSALHEGLIGVLGNDGLQEITYKSIEDKKEMTFKVSDAWLGITDKYWAATLIPDKAASIDAAFAFNVINNVKTYRADYLSAGQTIAPGASASTTTRLFAGAKEVAVLDAYQQSEDINRFDRLIDWGWFYFITKPLFKFLDLIYHYVGNFGIAILIVTVIIKGLFFPLANRSYASMAKMKAVQPQMQALRERYADDKVKQQQELMELYKREKINPIAGCLPIVIQIPVFFSLYKVLIVTIEMRHAPFFGWIHDLSAPDPTTVFNLFGLIPYDPSTVPFIGHFLLLGAWPLIMGVTMWVQMKLNPAPPDPAQKVMFDWMPVIFTFMLANFSAGLVIYWAWNNTLSVLQQSAIMSRHGTKIELFSNLRTTFQGLKSSPERLKRLSANVKMPKPAVDKLKAFGDLTARVFKIKPPKF
jgi:YidC/Oxa1 family membrane protein insertase